MWLKQLLKQLLDLSVKFELEKKFAVQLNVRVLNVFKSARHIYAQLIDDTNGTTLVATSTLSEAAQALSSKGNITAATLVGKEVARLALEKGVSSVVFDRNGFLYHGRIKALADSAREAGLNF